MSFISRPQFLQGMMSWPQSLNGTFILSYYGYVSCSRYLWGKFPNNCHYHLLLISFSSKRSDNSLRWQRGSSKTRKRLSISLKNEYNNMSIGETTLSWVSGRAPLKFKILILIPEYFQIFISIRDKKNDICAMICHCVLILQEKHNNAWIKLGVNKKLVTRLTHPNPPEPNPI